MEQYRECVGLAPNSTPISPEHLANTFSAPEIRKQCTIKDLFFNVGTPMIKKQEN